MFNKLIDSFYIILVLGEFYLSDFFNFINIFNNWVRCFFIYVKIIIFVVLIGKIFVYFCMDFIFRLFLLDGEMMLEFVIEFTWLA